MAIILQNQTKSSFIERVLYNQKQQRLLIVFVKGDAIAYDGVPMRVVLCLLRDPSMGAYYNTRIRHAYDSEPIEPSAIEETQIAMLDPADERQLQSAKH